MRIEHYGLFIVLSAFVVLGGRTIKYEATTLDAIATYRHRNESHQLGVPGAFKAGDYYQLRVKVLDADISERDQSDTKITFPDDAAPHISHSRFAPPPPPPTASAVCSNTTFCEHPPAYPREFIQNELRIRHDFTFTPTVDLPPEIGQRIDADDENEQSLCGFYETVVYPKSAQNKDNEWLWIVNDNKNLQGVRIEECSTENTACNFIDGFAEGYKTLCKQKYIYRKLAAISNGSLSTDLFRFPASCCCHVKFMGNPLMRIRLDARFKQPQSPDPRTTTRTAPTARERVLSSIE